MLLKICIITLTLVPDILADQGQGYPVNVGTVLFSAKDTEKQRWSKNEIALLQARKHFEKVLPPPIVYNNFDKEYIYNLLHYFRRAFSNIKKEDVDKHTSTILKRALSDALGGHLKVWVIPISKLNFYGGSITREDLSNLYKFYDELKDYLGTDGDGWRGPDDVLMNNIKINVAPLKITSFIVKDPCGQITFFEKTENRLGIPLPHVNWDLRLSTMFVPLKKVSLIPMNSPDQENALINYYDIAKRCIAVSNPAESQVFEDKFQRWLDGEVIPHLKDDNMYYALDGVLTIANRTRALYNIALQQYGKNHHSQSATHIPFDITSKKMMIIFVILLLEIAWCVPALIYLLCTKKKRDYSKKVYLFLNPKRKKDRFSFFRKENHKNLQIFSEFPPTRDLKDIETQRPSTLLELADADTSFTGHSYFRQDPIVSYTEFEAQCPSSRYTVAVGTGSRSYFTSKNKSTEAIVASNSKVPRKSSLKKTLDSQIRTINTARVLPLSSQEKLRRLEQAEIVSINGDTGKISPIRKLHSKEIEKKTAIPQRRCKVIKSSSPRKYLEHSKDSKSLQQNRTEQIKDLKSNVNNQKSNDSTNPQIVKTTPRCKIQKPSEPETEIIEAFETLLTRDSSEIYGNINNTESDITELEDPSYRQCPVECRCSSCYSPNVKYEVANKLINNIVQLPSNKTIINAEANLEEERQSSSKTTRFKIFKERKSRKGLCDVSELGKPLFEITIDRPATGICVDVSEGHKKLPKRSRIPKQRTNIPELVMQQTVENENVLNFNNKEKPKSLIPKLKRRTLDDIILTRANVKSEVRGCNKLNDTI